MILHSLF